MSNEIEIERLEKLREQAIYARDMKSADWLKQRIADIKAGVVTVEQEKPEEPAKAVEPYKSAFENDRPGSIQKETEDIAKIKKAHQQELLVRDEIIRSVKEVVREGYDTFDVAFDGVSGLSIAQVIQKLFVSIKEQVVSIVSDYPVDDTPDVCLTGMTEDELIEYGKGLGLKLDKRMKMDTMITAISNHVAASGEAENDPATEGNKNEV